MTLFRSLAARRNNLGGLLAAFFIFGPALALAANPFAGNYGGAIYTTVAGYPEMFYQNAALQVDDNGNIIGIALGTVDNAGSITWNTPNTFAFTNGVITNGVMSSTGTSGAVTFRLAATYTGGNFVGGGSLLWRAPSTASGYTPGLGNYTWNAVAYGKGRFVAVGFAGLRAVSLDGVNWGDVPVVTKYSDLNDIAYGNGIFLAVGSNSPVMISTDGYAWATNSPNNYRSLAFGGGQFIALNNAGVPFASTDGLTWSAVAGVAPGQNFTAVDYANGLFVLVGSTGCFQTSPDGTTWNPARTNGTTALFGTTYGAGRWVIGGTSRFVTFANATGSDQAATNTYGGYNATSVASGGNVLVAGTSFQYAPVYSSNGLSYAFASGLQDMVRAIAYGTNGVFVAVGNYIQSSTNGRAWTIRSTTLPAPVANSTQGTNYGVYQASAIFNDALNRRREVRVGQGGLMQMRFLDATNGPVDFVSVPSPTTNTLRRILGAIPPVVVGDAGTILQYDSANDGWKKIPSPTMANLYDAVNNGQSSYVAVGSGGTIIRASDYYGTNWSVVATGTGSDLYAVYNNLSATFLACGDNGTLLFSGDSGASWSSRVTGVTNRLVRATGGDYTGTFYAFPDRGQYFLVSTNSGANWFQAPLGCPLGMNNAGKLDNGYGLTVQSGLYGGSVSYYTGPGGFYTAPNLPAYRSAAYGNGRFVLLGGASTAVSTNGVNWIAGRTETAFRYAGSVPGAITYGQGIFVALGGFGVVETSPDGLNWKITNPGLTNINFNAVAFGGGRFVGVGDGGMIYSSTNAVNWEDYSFANTSGSLATVAYGNSNFVAFGFQVGGTQIIRYSTNGVNWTAAGVPSGMNRLLGFANGRFVGSGNNQLFLSANGANSWTTMTLPATYFYGNQVAGGGGRYVVGCGTYNSGDNGATVLNSSDGTNWFQEILPGSGDYANNIPNGVIAANGKFVIYSARGMVLTEDYIETNAPALVTVQPAPASQTVNGGATVVYTAAASGSGSLTYRWLRNGSPLFDGPGVSGAATTTLTLTGVEATAGGTYQFTAANSVGSDASQAISLAVNAAPVFTLQPQNTVVTNTGFTNLAAIVTGAGPIGYQWFTGSGPVTNNNAVLVGANGSVLAFKPATRINEADYYLVATNVYGAATSSVAHLTILRPPTIDQLSLAVAPAPGSNFLSPLLVFPGQTLSFGSVVDGTGPLTYQWKQAGNNLAGATNPTFSVPNIQGAGAQTYSLQVTNPYGAALVATQFAIIGAGTLRPDMAAFTNSRPVLDVALLADGSYLAAGWFELSLGSRMSQFSLANLTTFYQTNLQPLANYSPGFRSIGVLSDGSYVVGGTFVANGGVTPNFTNLIRFLPNGALDPSFHPANTNNISKIIPQPGGKFLALRAMDAAATIAYITRYNADGTVDNTFNQIVSGTSSFWGLAQQTNGTLWFGANGDGLRQANSDGSGVTSVDPNYFAGHVFTPADGMVYYVPTTVGGGVMKRRNADGSTNAFGVQINNAVNAVVTLPDGKIVVGGNFTAIGATTAYYLAMLNPDGTLYTNFVSPFSLIGGAAVNDIELLADGSALLATTALNGVRRVQLYMPELAIQAQPVSRVVNRTATASFSVVASGNAPINYQWRFNGVNMVNSTNSTLTLTNVQDSAAGNYDVIVSSVSGTNVSAIATLTVLGDVLLTQQPVGQSVLVGGSAGFSAAASGATPITFQWRKNGTNILGATSNVLALANVSLADLALYDVVAANFIGSVTSAPAALSVYATTNGIGNAVGTIDTNYLPALLPANSANVVSVMLDSSNKVLITGSFTNFAGQARTNFMRLNRDLTVDTPLVALNSAPVPAVGLMNGGFALGGYFSSAGGATRYGLTFYDSAGTLLPQPVLNANGYVDGGYGKNAFAVQPDGKVMVGGYFTSVNSTARTNLARLNPDGSLDATFNPAAINQQVTTAAVQPDGKILIAGYFTSVGGVAQAAVARLNANGSYDNTFTNTFTFSSPYGIRLQSNGKILIFGNGLTLVGGQSRTGIARLNADGSLDTGFNAGVTAAGNLSVQDVFVEADDRLVIVGNFTSVGGVSRKGVARLNADGTLDTTFATGTGVAGGSALVYSVVKLPEDGYLIGGMFTSYDGVACRGLVRLNGNPQPPPARAILFQPQSQTVAAGAAARFTVAATGTAPLTFQWRKEGTNILNATGTSLVITNVQSSDVASYDVIVTDFGGSTTSQTASLTLQSLPGFSSWIAGFSLAAGQTDANADPDGDGLANAMEYALGTNPNLSSADQSPMFASQNLGGVLYPAVQFTRNRTATGVTIHVSAWPSLTAPTPLPTLESAVDLGNGLDLVTVRSAYSMTAYSAQFLKVFVTQP